MITYTWQFSALDCYPTHQNLSDVIFTIHWRYSGTDGTYTHEVYSTTSLEVPTSENFIPYENLTQEILEGWMSEKLGEEGILAMQETIANQIAEKHNPTKVTKSVSWI